MADATQGMMHADFPRWYREVGFGEDRDRVQRRWDAISSMIPRLDRPAVENILRVVYRAKGGPAPEAVGNIRQTFKDADALFDMQGNDREVEVLCGSIVAVLLERDADLAAWAALAITTSALHGNRTAQLPMDIVAVAENTIARIAEKNRVRPNLQDARLDMPTIGFTKAKEKLQTVDPPSLNNAFDAAAEATNVALSSMVTKFNRVIGTTADFIAIQDEELNMLWWVLGERSHGAKKTFAAIPKQGRPLILGAELAEATVYLPGPLSVEGLLARAGLQGDHNLTIPDAVNACDESWLKLFSDAEPVSPLSRPIHYAIRRKLETGDATSWISGWAASCGVDASAVYPSLTLGNLFYRERLLSIF